VQAWRDSNAWRRNGWRLEKVFAEIDETPRGKTCDAIMGILEEGQEVMKEFKGAPAAPLNMAPSSARRGSG
jgi:ferritin-like metal-binding protein YciE